jgi:hypothetical protein
MNVAPSPAPAAGRQMKSRKIADIQEKEVQNGAISKQREGFQLPENE